MKCGQDRRDVGECVDVPIASHALRELYLKPIRLPLSTAYEWDGHETDS